MKKRDILPALNKCIESLVSMSADCAKLEIMDNEKASKRLKISVSDFKSGPLKDFQDLVFAIRKDMNAKPKRVVEKKGIEVPGVFLNAS